MDDFLLANRANWDDRAALHADRGGKGYRVGRYIDDAAALSDVVRFDRERLGDIRGLHVAHLQCHIGTDTLSLARLGARVTGLDFSPVAVAEARQLAADAGAEVEYVVSDVADAVSALGAGGFDLVYTRHRGPVLAAEHPDVGGGRRGAARARRAAVPAGGASDPLGRR